MEASSCRRAMGSAFSDTGIEAAAGGHGARRHQHHVDAPLFGGGDLFHEPAHHGHVGQPVFAGNHVGTYLYDYFPVSRTPA
jgi:hypothetical protein